MKIHICGIYGSGKSTLAKKLSVKLKIPFYSLDDIKPGEIQIVDMR